MSAFGPPRGTTEVTGATFDDAVLRSPVPVLVEFGADWCGPCRMIAPVLTAIADEQRDRLAVSVLDYDGSPEIGARYGVLGLPTLILFRDGEAGHAGHRGPPESPAAGRDRGGARSCRP